MFGRPRLDFLDIRRFILDSVSEFDYLVKNETENSAEVDLRINSRNITIRLSLYRNKKLTVDVTDSYYLLRIPRAEFKDMKSYKQFITDLIPQFC